MNVSDIPSDMMSEIRLRFESSPEVRALRTQQQLAQREGRLGDALKVAQYVDGLFSTVVSEYMAKAESEIITLDTETADIPVKDKDEMVVKLTVLFMCCDMIDFAVRDLNDILHRTKPDLYINTFEDISQVSEMAKMKLKFLQETGDYMQDLIWCDKCDDMYKMANNKARSIVRKRKNDPNWGENMRRMKNEKLA